MSDYGVEIYAGNKQRLFTSHQRILKLQGFRVIRGSGRQKIELKLGIFAERGAKCRSAKHHL